MRGPSERLYITLLPAPYLRRGLVPGLGPPLRRPADAVHACTAAIRQTITEAKSVQAATHVSAPRDQSRRLELVFVHDCRCSSASDAHGLCWRMCHHISRRVLATLSANGFDRRNVPVWPEGRAKRARLGLPGWTSSWANAITCQVVLKRSPVDASWPSQLQNARPAPTVGRTVVFGGLAGGRHLASTRRQVVRSSGRDCHAQRQRICSPHMP